MHSAIDFTILNISRTGICIETSHPMKTGKTYLLEMKLVIKHFSEIVRAEYVVMNENRMGSTYHYGCQIVNISPSDAALLEKYLNIASKP
ncbi:MAG: PilZ domain-containing protein [Candidatus Ratteibacteria bacterium]